MQISDHRAHLVKTIDRPNERILMFALAELQNFMDYIKYR